MAAKKAKNQNINETRSKNKQKVALRRKVLRSTRSCRGNSADRIIQLIPLFWGSRNQPVAGPRPWCLDRSLLAIVAIRFRLESIPSRTTALSLSLSLAVYAARPPGPVQKKKQKQKQKTIAGHGRRSIAGRRRRPPRRRGDVMQRKPQPPPR